MPIGKPLSPHTRIFSRGPILHGRTPTFPNSPRCLPKTTVGPGPAPWASALLRGPREGPGERTSSTCVLGAWTPLKHRVPLRWPRIPRGSLVTGGSRGQRSPSSLALPSVSYTMGCTGFGAVFGLVRGPLPMPGTEDGLLPQHVQVQPRGWIWADQAGGALTTDVLRPDGDPGPRGEQRGGRARGFRTTESFTGRFTPIPVPSRPHGVSRILRPAPGVMRSLPFTLTKAY